MDRETQEAIKGLANAISHLCYALKEDSFDFDKPIFDLAKEAQKRDKEVNLIFDTIIEPLMRKTSPIVNNMYSK